MSQPAKIEILLDDSFAFEYDLYRNDEPHTTAPDTSTIDIRDPSGTKIVDGSSLTKENGPEGKSNRYSFQLTAVLNDMLGEDFSAFYKIDWSGDDPLPVRHTVLFDVVKTLLGQTVTERDLLEISPQLDDLRRLDEHEGGVITASSTTIVDASLSRLPDDWFTGGRVWLIAGLGDGQTRIISNFVRSTGTVTVDPAWTTTPDSTSRYLVARSWDAAIDTAFERIKSRLRRRGWRPALVINASELHYAHVLLSVSGAYEIAANAAGEPAGANQGPLRSIAEDYEKKFDEEFRALKLSYDVDEDLVPEGRVELASVRMARR